MPTTTPVPRADSRPADTYQVLILRLWQEGGPTTPGSPPWRWKQENDTFASSGAGAQDIACATVDIQPPGGRV